jgi:hypothetical protein
MIVGTRVFSDIRSREARLCDTHRPNFNSFSALTWAGLAVPVLADSVLADSVLADPSWA